jgi:hypothetical protein
MYMGVYVPTVFVQFLSISITYISPKSGTMNLATGSQVEKILPLHLFSSSKFYFVRPQWITQVKLMLRRNVQIHCIYSLYYSEIYRLSNRVQIQYMGVYVPTVFVKNFKHMYITYMLAGLPTKLPIFETASL